MQLFGADRLKTEYYLPMLYDQGRYKDFFARFFEYQWVGPDSYIGISAIAAPCLVALFIKKGNKTLKCSFVILTIGVLVPVFGWMMNGFGYVTNRWSFAYSFCLANVIVVMLPRLRETFDKIKFIPIVSAVAYAIVVMLLLDKRNYETMAVLAMVLVACALASVSSIISEKLFWSFAAIVAILSLSLNGMFFNMPGYGSWLEKELAPGEALSMIEGSSALGILSEDQRTENVRFDKKDVDYVKNACWYQGMSGLDL